MESFKQITFLMEINIETIETFIFWSWKTLKLDLALKYTFSCIAIYINAYI